MSEEVAPASTQQPYDREKRVLLTRSQDQQLTEFLRKLEHATGGLRITGSDLTRGLLAIVLQTEDAILRSAASASDRTKNHPATADRAGKEIMERQLAATIIDAVRCSESSRSDIAI